jgi:TonB family protein
MAMQLPNSNPKQTGRRIPGFLVPQEPWARGLFSRMRSYLTERPAKVTAAPPPGNVFKTVASGRFGAGFAENVREFFHSSPGARAQVKSRMLVDTKAWYAVFWENLRDAIAPRKLPPLHVTSKPVKVRDIWSKNEQFQRTQAISLTVHAALVTLLVLPIFQNVIPTTQAAKKPTIEITDISPYLAQLPAGKDKAGGGGGGGERSLTPASKGKLPKFSMKPQFSRPMVVVRNLNPKLAIDPTLFGPPEIKLPSPNLPNYGDPLAAVLTDSSGTGSGSGIGSGEGGGIGSGRGGGLGPGEGGGTGGGVFRAGRDGVGIPACLYCPNPQFTDEAVKARYQGVVMLRIIVTPDGRATNISVVKGLGLGLDEKAVEAVKGWRFTPARGPNGQTVSVWTTIEVNFRQY